MGRCRDGVVAGSYFLQNRISEAHYVRGGERVATREAGLAPLRQGGKAIMVLLAFLLRQFTKDFPLSGGGFGEGVAGT